jgi:parvulin-like peptidyl-prolyl isomerase
MTFRNRPVLNRKHRPRWQDELRTQQLTVAGFAAAIAVAIGIFAAVAWSSFYDANLRQVALVHGRPIDQAQMTRRTDLVTAQLTATYITLSAEKGGAQDQAIDQQLQSLQQAIQSADQIASGTIVNGIVLDQRAPDFGISVGDDELNAEVEKRRTLPARVQLSLILVQPQLDAGAAAGSAPTDQNWADAKAQADDLKSQLDGGADFAQLATDNSDDTSATTGGSLGWLTEDSTIYTDYLDATKDAATGDVVGPLKNDQGWYLVKVNDRKPAERDSELDRLLSLAGLSDADYRAFVREDMLQTKFRDYFENTVVGRYAAQRDVSQIMITPDETGSPSPKIQIRHLLAQPLPGAQDQSTATDAQWAAALERAKSFREEASKPDADWYELAKQSDDPGSRTKGGSLGWYDPGALDQQFVKEFADAAAALDVGELSEPIKSEFGYHIIEITDRRVSAAELANRLVEKLRDKPDSFYETARDYSEDAVTASKGGELGWVLRYQYDAEKENVIFGLTEPGQISDPYVTDSGVYIFKLNDTSDARWVPQSRRDQVTNTGFARWLGELRDQAGVWTDPALSPATTAGAGSTSQIP